MLTYNLRKKNRFNILLLLLFFYANYYVSATGQQNKNKTRTKISEITI